jgi:hypothetical protein
MLNRLLEQLGLGYDELSDEERKTWEKWQATLDRPDLTIDDVVAWLATEQAETDKALADYANSERKMLFLQATSRLVRMLSAILTRPEQERETLKKQIEQMLKS